MMQPILNPIRLQIAGLNHKSMAELRGSWRQYFGKEPPNYRRGFMIKCLSYRLQELTYGGLSDTAKRRIERLIAEQENCKEIALKKQRPSMVAGTRLVREWGGVLHSVTILSEGFEYQGRKWKSLSSIAKKISGQHCGGPRFFGLRRESA
jgi:hypothetical protein